MLQLLNDAMSQANDTLFQANDALPQANNEGSAQQLLECFRERHQDLENTMHIALTSHHMDVDQLNCLREDILMFSNTIGLVR
jgi:hypothetical protein